MKRHQTKKFDRLMTPDAKPEEIACDHACAPFDRAMRDAERKWGIDRLPGLVSPETAAKFGSAMGKLNDAINSGDAAATAARVGVCIRGLAAMDAEAVAAGHQPTPPEAWDVEVAGRVCAIIRDDRLWPVLAAARPGLTIYTLREVALALAEYGQGVVKVKEAFSGAEVTAIRERTKLEEDLADEIPW